MDNEQAAPSGGGNAASVSSEPRVLASGSLSNAFRAGESGGSEEREATFDDIFAPPDTASGSEDTPTAEPPPPATETDGNLLQRLAAEYGLNPGDPKHKALLEKMSKEAASAPDEQEGAEQGGYDSDEDLGDYARALLAEEEPPVYGQQALPPVQTLEPGKFGDSLDDTSTWEQALEKYREAWAEDDDGNVDMRKAADVMNGLFMRQFVGIAAPLVNNMINGRLQQELGEYIHYARQQREADRRQSMYAEVLGALKGQKGYEQLDDLFRPLSENNIKVRSREVQDTLINRVLRDRPWILDIEKRTAPDGRPLSPDKALKYTHLARLRAVMKHVRESKDSVPIKDATALIEAGKQMERKKQQEATRQQLNAGPGATGYKQENDKFMERVLTGGHGQATSVRDILSMGRR